jgi:hypothetical protein
MGDGQGQHADADRADGTRQAARVLHRLAAAAGLAVGLAGRALDDAVGGLATRDKGRYNGRRHGNPPH